MSLFSANFLLSLIQLPSHGLYSVIGLKRYKCHKLMLSIIDNVTDLLYLFLVLIRVTSLVLELHHQLLDLLLQPPVGLGPQHPLLGLGRQLLLQVTNLGLQGSCKVTIFTLTTLGL